MRVIRKSDRTEDKGTSRLIYSGLYNVVECWRVDREFESDIFKICKYLLMQEKAYDYDNPPLKELVYIHGQLEMEGLK